MASAPAAGHRLGFRRRHSRVGRTQAHASSPQESRGPGACPRGDSGHAAPRVPAYLAPSGVYQPFFERARAEGWRCRELNGGHYAMLTVPNVVVTALLELADEREAGMSTSGSTGDG